MEKNKEMFSKSIEQLANNYKHDLTSVQLEEFEYTWEIVNFKHYSDVYLFPTIESPFFQIANLNFKLYMVLRNEFENYLALNIKTNTNSNYIQQSMRFEVSLLDKNKNRKVLQNQLSKYNSGYRYYSLPNFQDFVSKDFVFNEKNGLLPNGSLIIHCKIYWKQSSVHYSRPLNVFNETDRLKRHQKNFKHLLENGKFSDVVLVIDDKVFNVHKSFLSSHSPVLSAMFEHKMKESNDNTVLISDIRPEVMKEVLNYIYSGEFDNFETLGKDILAAADKYEINGLRMTCEEKFINNLSIENIEEMLTIIDSCDTIKLKKYVLEFLKIVDKNFFKTKKFDAVTKLLSIPLLTEIFETFSL